MSEKNIVKSPFADIDIPNISVGEYVYNKLKQFNDQPVLVEAKTDEWITAEQLITVASNTAIALIRRGITKSDIICCFSHNNLSYVSLKIAAYFLGVTISESSPINNIHELENNFLISEPTYLFASRAHIPLVEQLLERNTVKQPKLIVVLDGVYGTYLTFDELSEEANGQTLSKIPYFDVNPKTDICEILYTSGTSGLSKAAMLSNHAMVAMLQTFYTFDNLDASENQIAILFLSLAHSSGTICLPLWLCSGFKIVLLEYFNEENVLKSIEKYSATIMPVMPLFGYKLADGLIGDNYDLSSLEIVVIAGTHFNPSAAVKLIEKFKITFVNLYVMTEFSVFTWNNDREFISGSCGRVAPNVELKIVDLDNNCENLEANKDGEICVRGPTLFSGYLKNENATKEAIDSDAWFHTGDVGHYDDTGRLYVTDRVKELIKYGMSSVAPAEIEQFLLKKDGIQDVVVIGVPYKIGIHLPRAYVKLTHGFSITEEEIKKYVAENMTSKNELRGGVVFVDSVVKSIIGKTDRKYYKNLVKNECLEK